MAFFNSIIQWFTASDWGTTLLAIISLIGALDVFLLAALKVSNLLFPKVTWDDNVITLIHNGITTILGLLGKIKK